MRKEVSLMKRKKRNRMTRPHRRLCRVLDECGVSYEVEAGKGPYQIDCFSSELNLGFEADGPHHAWRRGKDRRRDKNIHEEFGTRILRLDYWVLNDLVVAKAKVLSFVQVSRPMD
jgi:very-short-patch-repair endonuclease